MAPLTAWALAEELAMHRVWHVAPETVPHLTLVIGHGPVAARPGKEWEPKALIAPLLPKTTPVVDCATCQKDALSIGWE